MGDFADRICADERRVPSFLAQLREMFPSSAAAVGEAYVEAHFRDWGAADNVRGGYSYPRGPLDREGISEPEFGGKLFFAGEHTHTGGCCTVHAAVETGKRAAGQVAERLATGERAAGHAR
ncbi:hypothetical protein TeGR_g6114 [Tetraparma gracilis]|uniref:Amine oxidase domain-containing protein n=1 Tax=Tetraparma gracilis TaxID=2962635 RepID=A0ABQ6NDD7_9STRA|nr:hypothetical protein TeGR_g6114 [Tetraparma gracilis]